jgi:hypothetical protein
MLATSGVLAMEVMPPATQQTYKDHHGQATAAGTLATSVVLAYYEGQ